MLIAPGIPSWLLGDGCIAAKAASNLAGEVSDAWKRWDLLENSMRASCASGSCAALRRHGAHCGFAPSQPLPMLVLSAWCWLRCFSCCFLRAEMWYVWGLCDIWTLGACRGLKHPAAVEPIRCPVLYEAGETNASFGIFHQAIYWEHSW